MNESKMMWAISDNWVMFRRSLKHMLRNPESIFMGVGLPVVLMLMFVYVFGGAIATGTEYVNYIVPGIIITCVGYGSSLTAISINLDMMGGLFDRLRSMPVNATSLLSGHVAGSFVRNTVSALLVIVVAMLIGFRPNAALLDWLLVAGCLSLFMLSMCWLSVIFGLLAKSAETASAFSFLIMFLPYVSSAFVPTETMPSWLHAFSDNQPMTPLIETLRGLLLGTEIGSNGWISLLWFGTLFLCSYLVAMMLFTRKRKR